MNSFNVYGQTEQKVGGNTPVWLGTVKPIPVGAKCTSAANAGTAGHYDPTTKIFSPIGDLNMAGGTKLASCNAFAYNDVFSDSSESSFEATCAVVMHHPEGLLIERVYPEITEEQIQALQTQIPGVLLVRG